MNERVLLVDDEPHVLDGFRRHLHKKFVFETACGPEEALQKLDVDDPYAVIISDMRMPGMDGIELLKQVREKLPDTVRMMLTGDSDHRTAVSAVNEGQIFRFLTKPCPVETLAQAIFAGIEQFRLVTAEKTLLQRTLRGAINMLTEVLELSAPASFGRGKRVQKLVHEIAHRLKVPAAWQLDLAALFANAGHITLPPHVLQRHNAGLKLDPHDQEMLKRSIAVSSQLLNHIPRLDGVARILWNFAADNDQGEPRSPENMTATQILRLAYEFDDALTLGESPLVAVSELRSRNEYPRDLIDALAECAKAKAILHRKRVPVQDLINGMILDEDLKSSKDHLLVAKGQEVTLAMRERLGNFIKTGQLSGDVAVLVPGPEPHAAKPSRTPTNARQHV